jgi:hypothetical protein
MADVIIRSPLNGKNLAQVNYCCSGCGSHPSVLYGNPWTLGGVVLLLAPSLLFMEGLWSRV